MELKDVILSTLAEMEDTPRATRPEQEVEEIVDIPEIVEITPQVIEKDEGNTTSIEGELQYLNSIKERLLVLFEGFQAPNNTNIEAKVDMTLNFLEYTLATIDTRLETLEKGHK